jgi:UDP-glucose 4-epimerase
MRVLVTGAARDLGAEVVRRLEWEPAVDELLGLDFERPQGRFRKLRLIRGDVRSASVSERIRDANPDVIVHCALHVARGSTRAAHEWNVIGTMNVLAGCRRVRKLILRSSAVIYPTGLEMPSLLREDDGGKRSPVTPLGRDLFEIEGLVADFAAAHPDTITTVLRLGHSIGAHWRTLMSDYLSLAHPPTFPGFDPRIQLLGEEDAAEAVIRAITAKHPGVFNVAGAGILLLSQLLAMARRTPRPMLPPVGGRWFQRQAARALAGADVPSDLLSVLTWGSVMDVSLLYQEFGWRPPRTSREAAAEYVRAHSPVVLSA